MKITIEVCTNIEWLREYGGPDLDCVPEDTKDDACCEYICELMRRLEDEGYVAVHARGQRRLCHGWNGCNTFRWKCGPLGTFDELTDQQKLQLIDIENAVETAVRQKFARVVVRNTNSQFGDPVEFDGATEEEAVSSMQECIRDCGDEFEDVVVTADDYEVVSRGAG